LSINHFKGRCASGSLAYPPPTLAWLTRWTLSQAHSYSRKESITRSNNNRKHSLILRTLRMDFEVRAASACLRLYELMRAGQQAID
jgi:hypothetical protein